MNHFEHLFKPIKIGNMLVPNRICHAPTDVSSSHADGSISERDIYHHEEVAKGGVGLIIVGAATPDAATGRPTVTGIVADNDNFIPGLARLAEGMHRYNAKCLVQIQHPGRQAVLPRYNYMSTNDMVIKLPWSAGHEIVYENAEEKGKEARAMSTEEALAMIEKFAEAAWRVYSAGFDGVELHAAHGYMISQFMSPYLNRRIDRFGGSFENRMRFPLAIIKKIQDKCGKNFPITVRWSVQDWAPGGLDLPESIEIAKAFELAGVSALNLSNGMQDNPGPSANPMPYPQGWTLYASEEIKKHVNVPVIVSHGLRDPEFCDRAIAEGKTDLVGLSRQMLADPYWAVKARMGKTEEIRKCISCRVGCWQESLQAKKEIRCTINPACGNPIFQNITKIKKPLNVAVVGGGPAGMEAARIATVRGSAVTLFEKTGELGGAILGCCMAPGKEKMKWYADWIRRQINKLGVTVKLGTQPTVEELKSFDIVLNATGAASYIPNVYGDSEKIIGFEQVMACPRVNCEYHPGNRTPVKLGERVVVVGDGYPAVDTVLNLASLGKNVTVVTANKEFGSDIERVHMYVFRKFFNKSNPAALNTKPYKFPVNVMTNARILEIDGDSVVVEDKNFGTATVQADAVVSCLLKPNTELFEQLVAAGVTVVNVGDSKKPRNLSAAVYEGAMFAMNLDEHMLVNPNGAFMTDIPTDVLGQLLR